jgi:hypothetical protein
MTLHAFICFECVFAVMADAAGLPLFHLGHRDGLFGCHVINLGVTDCAIVSFEVFLVAEGYRSGLFHLHGYIRDLVAADAIIQRERPLAVVASAAGEALLHIRHRETGFLPEIVNCIVACLAVILDPFLPEMVVMTEHNFAKVGYFKGDIFDVYRVGESAG